MLFTVFFSPNIIAFDFWVFKVSLFLSNQFSIFLGFIFINLSNKVESSPEARSVVPTAKRRVFKFEAFGRSFMYRRNKIGRYLMDHHDLLNFYLICLSLYCTCELISV